MTGQIFIVTRGAENIKLGAVEVLLVERPQVIDFLQKKQSDIESVIASRRQEVAIAKENVKKAEVAFNWFLANGYPATNADCVKIRAKLQAVRMEFDALDQQFYSVNAQQDFASRQGNSVRANALLKQQKAITEKGKTKTAEADLLIAELMSTVSLGEAAETNKFETAKSRVLAAEARLENSPTDEDYFTDFSPSVFRKTLTDADGRFSFALPHNKSLTIFASAQRAVLDRVEKYYWLINAPANAENAQVFLSNNNLIFVDPDEYFKLKPKQAR